MKNEKLNDEKNQNR